MAVTDSACVKKQAGKTRATVMRPVTSESPVTSPLCSPVSIHQHH